MRSKPAIKRRINPDPVYGNAVVAKLVNTAMMDGKKTVCENQVYQAFKLVGSKTGQGELAVFLAALENIKPQMEVRARRIGGAAYQIPAPVRQERKESLALRWLVAAARARPNKEFRSFGDKLAAEIIEAFNQAGAAVKKRNDMHRMAEANRAFAHFRW